MPFLLLLFLPLACLPENWDPPLWPHSANQPAAVSAALTWLIVALVLAFARGIVTITAVSPATDFARREYLLRRYSRLRTYHIFILIGAHTVALYLLGWGWTVQELCGRGHQELPGAEVLLLAPFLTGLVLSWVIFYDAERSLHDAAGTDDPEPFWSRGAYVAFHVRQNLALVFAPLMLLILMKGLGRVVPKGQEADTFTTVAAIALAVAVFVGFPWVLRLVLGLQPLPPGELRDRLECAARRVHFRCGDILVWDTRGGMANAMVAGIVPWVRYVILTDRLMSELTPDEVEAVFGHEIGHVKHHHMLYYVGFVLGSLLLVFVVFELLANLLASYHVPLVKLEDNLTPQQALVLVTMLGAYLFTVFGFLSRRCERQADVYGCRAVSCGRPDCGGHEVPAEPAPRRRTRTTWRSLLADARRSVRPLEGTSLCPTGIRTFIEALEKVARLNGISRDKPGWLSSWQHSTIARRVDFLQDVLRNPALERRFQWRVTFVKLGLLLGMGAALVGLMYLG
jgi:Zn-dependent protease with chaperone function